MASFITRQQLERQEEERYQRYKEVVKSMTSRDDRVCEKCFSLTKVDHRDRSQRCWCDFEGTPMD